MSRPVLHSRRMATPERGIEAVELDAVVRFSRTVSESDIYLFAGITGDHSPV